MFGSSFFRGKSFYDFVTSIGKENKTDHCLQCGRCCHVAPCSISIEELEKIAKFKNITKESFFKEYCAVNYEDQKYYVILRRPSWDGGKYVPDYETYNVDPCIFYKYNNQKDIKNGGGFCLLEKIKPSVAKKVKCWENSKEPKMPVWKKKDIIELGWDGLKD